MSQLNALRIHLDLRVQFVSPTYFWVLYSKYFSENVGFLKLFSLFKEIVWQDLV